MYSSLVVFCIPLVVTSTSLFKSTPNPSMVTSHRCPGPYNLNDPWYPDDEDCGCYYVCGITGTAARMCCPDGLWWEQETKTCIYFQDFNNQHQEKCKNLVRGVGTTKQLREIFLGRCWEYQRYVNVAAFQEGYRDCEDMFDTFARVFVNKAPCKDVKAEDYAELVQKASVDLPPSSQVFWSGTYGLAQEYVAHGRRGFTLETTMIGYILNDVTWCGATVSPGINFESCPAFASCPDHVMASFWAKALESFAAQAEGVVTIMLNGSRTDGPAFRNNSFFAEHEFPNLDPSKVNTIRVWVAHDLLRKPTETCTSKGSLWTFQQVAEERGFKFECQDNPSELMHLLCAYSTKDPKCQFKKTPLTTLPVYRQYTQKEATYLQQQPLPSPVLAESYRPSKLNDGQNLESGIYDRPGYEQPQIGTNRDETYAKQQPYGNGQVQYESPEVQYAGNQQQYNEPEYVDSGSNNRIEPKYESEPKYGNNEPQYVESGSQFRAPEQQYKQRDDERSFVGEATHRSGEPHFAGTGPNPGSVNPSYVVDSHVDNARFSHSDPQNMDNQPHFVGNQPVKHNDNEPQYLRGELQNTEEFKVVGDGQRYQDGQ